MDAVYLIVSTMMSVFIHEFGHALAAARLVKSSSDSCYKIFLHSSSFKTF